MTELFRLLRPHQWIKNGFVLLGVIFSRQWDVPTLFSATLAFLAFCAIASSVYIFNDIMDVEADRQHPTKRNRPLAAGAISLRKGWWLSGMLVLLALLLAVITGPWVVLFVAMYAVLNVGYSLRWKRVPVLDVFIISAGFMLRILAGTVGLGMPKSYWMLLCGLMLTLFIGFAKRRAELLALERNGINNKALTRHVLDNYSPAMIEQFTSISAACTILSYSLYTVSADTIERYGTTNLIYTVPFVVYGIYRYLYLLYQYAKGNDTAHDLYADPQMLITVLGWLAVSVMVMVLA